MTNEKRKNNILPSQNRYLPIVLCFFPVLLLNIGWYFFSYYIDYRWIETEWIEQSKQDAELLSASSDLNYCVGRVSGDFFKDLKSGLTSFIGVNKKERLINYIKSRADNRFKPPFPNHTLFVFRLSSDNKPELIYSNTKDIMGKAALGKAFEYLVRVNSLDQTYSEAAKKSGATMTNRFLGGESDPSVMAETQRGKFSYSLYRSIPHFFIWDYIEEDKSNEKYGFFLLIENTKETEVSGRLMALKELRIRNSQNKKEKHSYGAFIPLFAGYGGIVADEEFAKMPEYKAFTKKWVPKNIKELSDWEFKNISPQNDKTKVGNYQAFFHLTNGQSHAAVLLKPLLDKPQMPSWLYLLNIFVISFILLLLIKGFLLGKWPNISLKLRFVITYFLAACMPLGLLIIASYGYISEYRKSEIFRDQSQLRLCINQFDTRKTQNQEEYKTAFLEIKNDSEFQRLIRKLDKANQVEPHGFPREAKAILKRILEILNKDKRYLPILGITILDERGNYFSNYGNNECSTFKIYEGDEYVEDDKLFLPDEFPKEELKIKTSNANSIEVVLYSFLQPMRNKIIEAGADKKWDKDYVPTWIQEIAFGGYKNARGGVGGSLTEELVNRRNLAIQRLVGDKTISSIYDNIFIDNIPRFAIYMQWDVADLDEESFKTSIDYFKLKEPNFVFSSYEITPLGIKPWIDSGRHSRELGKISRELADQAHLNNYASHRDENLTVIAVPSLKYKDKIIVGGVSHNYLKMPVFKRVSICVAIIVFALITLFICIYFSFKIFIKPIGKLKQVLDKVADGNLDITIKSGSKDEFGIMCHEFSDMTRELSERNKLATLLSDHAVEALSKNDGGSGAISDVETFKGTALVTDIRNFTGMCEKYNPEEITDLLNKHFAFMTKIFTANGGRIYKYIGDAIEVVFSDNDDFERNSVERAFIAAVEMLNTLREINLERRRNNLFEYRIGVGLCYSKMSSGSIGSLETRLDYAILGDALKNAAKLESFSKLNPEFPLIVDGQFISIFKKSFDNISFSLIKSEDRLEGFKIQNSTLDDLLKLIKISKIIDSGEVELNGNKNKTEGQDKTHFESFDINELIPFERKLTSGLIFIIVFFVILFLGFYFIDDTEKESEKLELKANNQRIIEQISCDNYGKVAFDNKCRIIAKSLQDRINLLRPNENLSDNTIIETLDNSYKSDNSIKGLGLNKVFVRIADTSNCKKNINNFAALFDNLPIYPIAISGYTADQTEKICNSFKIVLLKEKYPGWANEVINEYKDSIDIFPIYPKFIAKYIKGKIEQYKNNIVSHLNKEMLCFLRDNYGEPCRDLFGDKITIFLLEYDILNGSREATTKNEDCLLFNLDYYINRNRIGYLVMSMPDKNAYNSVPFILSSFFNKKENVVFRNQISGECYFSNNIPSNIQEKIKHISSENKDIKADKKILPIKDYLESKGFIINKDDKGEIDHIKISDDYYDVFIFELNTNNKKIIKYILFFIVGIILFYNFVNIINDNSSINCSIPAKLWLTLLIVAVIPVLTVYFVFSLFLNEHFSVRKSQKRGEMQRLMGQFESKREFSYPLTWNEIKSNNISPDLNRCLKILNNESDSVDNRNNAMKDLRKHFHEMITNNNKRAREEEISKNIMSCHISNVSISGKVGWSFCSSDKEEDDSITDKKMDISSFNQKRQEKIDNNQTSSNYVTYVDDYVAGQEDTFGLMLKMVAKFLMNRQLGEKAAPKSLKDTAADEIAIGTSLEIVKAFFGEDTFIKISHGVDIPIIFNIGFGKFGLMISTVPNFRKPEAVCVWLVIIETIDYLKRVQDKVESDIKFFICENFKYGVIAEDTKDNNLRIPLGEYMSWLSSSNVPISTSVVIEGDNKIVECAPALTQINSIIILLFSEKEIIDDVNKKAYYFYVLLAISLIIIIITTKNIADDIINPVNALILGVKEVNRENFSFRINSDRTDELGALCLSFDKMTKGLDEKRMMSRMISNTARMVTLDEGTITSGKTDAVLLYLGIPEFSKVMENLGDYEVFDLLKKQTAVMAGIIMEEGGEVDKIIGEKMLAVFRVNNNKSEMALAAYRVATRMLELEKTNKLSFSIAIGLNYGNVINGFLGVGNKRDFTVIGDPVNVAARIESLAESLESNRCVISETFYKAVNSSINAKPYGEVELKGKSQPMKVYQLS